MRKRNELRCKNDTPEERDSKRLASNLEDVNKPLSAATAETT
jgi:hypothetical protein